MVFKNYNELVERLVLPIGEHEYQLPEVSAKDGIRLRLALDPSTEETMSDDDFLDALLGEQRKRMFDNGAPDKAIMRAAMVALVYFQGNLEAAEVMWETGADPKALKDWAAEMENRLTRRSRKPVAESTTKPRASTNGTKISPQK